MGAGYYILVVFVIVVSIIGLIGIVMNVSKSGKEELLDKMFENNDIEAKIYKKYKAKI